MCLHVLCVLSALWCIMQVNLHVAWGRYTMALIDLTHIEYLTFPMACVLHQVLTEPTPWMKVVLTNKCGKEKFYHIPLSPQLLKVWFRLNYHIAENFWGRKLLQIDEIWISQRKLSQIARFCRNKGQHTPKFCGEKPHNRKIHEVFSLKTFPLNDIPLPEEMHVVVT